MKVSKIRKIQLMFESINKNEITLWILVTFKNLVYKICFSIIRDESNFSIATKLIHVYLRSLDNLLLKFAFCTDSNNPVLMETFFRISSRFEFQVGHPN